MLFILTSKRVLRKLFDGQNRLSDAKTTISATTQQNKQKIKGKPLKIKTALAAKVANFF